MQWWARIWSGSAGARLWVGVFLALCAFAILVSGSLTQVVRAVLAGGWRGKDDGTWDMLATAFSQDIAGTPGLFVSAVKTVFAVIIAFAVVWTVKKFRGEIALKLPTVELSGTQSSAVLWCAVFAIVKLL